VKGRALKLFREFQDQATSAGNPFGVCRVILMARVIPEQLTLDTDDPALEERLEQAIRKVSGGDVRR